MTLKAMKIGITYCGGCNPRYERTAIVESLRADFAEACLVRAGEESVDVVAVICGCHVACAPHELFTGKRGKVVLTRESDYETLRALIAPDTASS